MKKGFQEEQLDGFENGETGGNVTPNLDRFPETEDEVRFIEESLSNAMANLSVDEEERILFEMYGFPSGVETDEDLRSSLAENTGDIFRSSSVSQFKNQREKLSRLEDALERRLTEVQEKVRCIYQRAIRANPSFLYQQGLLFIAAVKEEGKVDNFNDAAKLLLDHLEVKSELFPETVLARHVEWTDLSEWEQELVTAGLFQFAPKPDSLGRMVLHASGHRVLEMSDSSASDEDFGQSLQRTIWYTLMSKLLTSSHTLNNGVVIAMCNITTRSLPFDVSKGLLKMIWRIPFRFRCFHIFLTSARLYVCYKALRLVFAFFASDSNKFGLHVHMATSILEMKVKMMSVGLDPAASPWAQCTNDASSWSRQSHLEWIDRQKTGERLASQSSKAGSTGFSLSASEIRSFDVLLGREKKCTEHLGTRRCKMMVGMKLEVYETSNAQGKTKIANDIVDYICQSGGRFLRFENGQWNQVSMKVARQKVAHFFRFLRGKGKAPLNVRVSC